MAQSAAATAAVLVEAHDRIRSSQIQDHKNGTTCHRDSMDAFKILIPTI